MHHELSAAINDDSDVKPASDTDDQDIYFSLADRRQAIAQKMADHIRNCETKRNPSAI
jgi:hypothetical protein